MTQCVNHIYDERASWRCGREAVPGGDICRVCYAAQKRGEARRAANAKRFEDESNARRDKHQKEQAERDRTARKLAAFDDLLKALEHAESVLVEIIPSGYRELSEGPSGVLYNARAAISKAKEAQK